MAGSQTKGKGKASGMLARRKAALERAALRVAEQRQVAAEAEAERLRKEAAFDELVADFELAVEDETSVAAEVEEEVRRVRERGQVRINEARVVAARVVLAMGDAGETVAGCGRRLGVGVERVKELRRLGREDLAGEGSERAPGKENALEKMKAAKKAAEKAAGGEQRDGVHAAGPAGRSAGAAPVAAPPVSAPPPSAGPSGAPVGGVRPGWPEPSR
ncbi:hypothetical protein [Streptomyces sp. NPDC058371]|uniref:hypothetical protein n=1 Tax=Streptomyces sp. NPDC058371 TaxID=3346463 RepID=UPI0036515789